MAILKLETDIITNVAGSPKGKAAILEIMYNRDFKTGVNVFVDNIIMCFTSHQLIILNLLSQFVDTDNVSEIKGNMSNH